MGKDKPKIPKQSPFQIHIKETNIFEQRKSKIKEVTDTVESTKRVKQTPIDKSENRLDPGATIDSTEEHLELLSDIQDDAVNTKTTNDFNHGSDKNINVLIPGAEIGGNLSINAEHSGMDVSKTIVGDISPDVKKVQRIHQIVDTNEAFREFQEALKSPGIGIRFETVISTDDKIVTTYVQKHDADDSFDQTTTIKEMTKSHGTFPRARGKLDLQSPETKASTLKHQHTGHQEFDLTDIKPGSPDVETFVQDINVKGDHTPSRKLKLGGKFGLFGKRKQRDKEEEKESVVTSACSEKEVTGHDAKHAKWESPKLNLKTDNDTDLGDINFETNQPTIDVDGEFGGKPYLSDVNLDMDIDVSCTDSEEDQVITYEPDLTDNHGDIKMKAELDENKCKTIMNIDLPPQEENIPLGSDTTNSGSIMKKTKSDKSLKIESDVSINLPEYDANDDIHDNAKVNKPNLKKKLSKDKRKSKEIEKFEVEIKEEDTGTLKRLFHQKFLTDKEGKSNAFNKRDLKIDTPSPDLSDFDLDDTTNNTLEGSNENIPKLKHKPKQLETENVEWDRKEEASGGFKMNLPKFGFGGFSKKGAYDVNVSDSTQVVEDKNGNDDKLSDKIDIKPKESTSNERLQETTNLVKNDEVNEGSVSKGFSFNFPKFKLGKSKKGSYDVIVANEEANSDSDISAHMNIDVDIDDKQLSSSEFQSEPSGEDMTINIKQIDVNVPSDSEVNVNQQDEVRKSKFELPHISLGERQNEEENVDVDIKEEVGFNFPRFKFGKVKKGKIHEQDLSSSKSTDDTNKNIKILDANTLSDINHEELNIDNVSEPDRSSNDMEDNIKDHSGKHKFKFGLPKFKFGGKDKSQQVDISNVTASGELKINEKTHYDNVNVTVTPDIGDVDNGENILDDLDVDLKASSGTYVDVDIKDPANVKGLVCDEVININDKLPDEKSRLKFRDRKQKEEENVDIYIKEEGQGGFGFDLSKFKFGRKKETEGHVVDTDIDINQEDNGPNIEGDIQINVPQVYDVKLPKQKTEFHLTDIDIKEDTDDLDKNCSPSQKHKFKFGLPKLKFGAKGKISESKNYHRESEETNDGYLPDVDMIENVNPEIDDSTSDKHNFRFRLPNIKGKKTHVDNDSNTDNVDDGGIKTDSNTGVDNIDLSVPDVDVNDADVSANESDKNAHIDQTLPTSQHQYKFHLPHVNFGEKQQEEENIDVDIKEENLKGITFHLPKFKLGKNKKSAVPDDQLSADLEVGGIDTNNKMPQVNIDVSDIDEKSGDEDMEIKGPNLSEEDVANINQPDIDTTPSRKHKLRFGFPKLKTGGKQKNDGSAGSDISKGMEIIKKLDTDNSEAVDITIREPKEGIDGSLSDVDIVADIEGPGIDNSLSQKNKFKFRLPHYNFNSKGKHGKSPKVNSDMPKANISCDPDSVKLDGTGLDNTDIDIRQPVVQEVDVICKEPCSVDIDLDIPVPMIIDGPNNDNDINRDDELPDGQHKYKFHLPNVKFGGKQEEEENVDIEVKEENLKGFHFDLPKFKFGKKKKVPTATLR